LVAYADWRAVAVSDRASWKPASPGACDSILLLSLLIRSFAILLLSLLIRSLAFQTVLNPDVVGPYDVAITFAGADALSFFRRNGFSDDPLLTARSASHVVLFFEFSFSVSHEFVAFVRWLRTGKPAC
jgi:hypothetical protein